MSEMRIKAILPYFGGKRSLAKKVVGLIGKHRVYWEPFCGSLAIAFAKPKCEMETVNDMYGDVINLARVLQQKPLAIRLYDKLYRSVYCEQLFNDAKKRCFSNLNPYTDQPDVERACDLMLASWMGINGFAGTKRYNYTFAMRWCVGGGQGSTRWANVVSSIPHWHKRLRQIVITNRNGFEMLDKIKDDNDVVIYCDPPYFQKSSKYIHDFKPEQHEQLAGALQRFKKARVIVSYFYHPKLTELYAKWKLVVVKKSKANLSNACNGGKKVNKRINQEVLLLNWVPAEAVPEEPELF